MAGKAKKRSAETPVEDLDDELGSPSNRSRVSEKAAAADGEEGSVKQEEAEMQQGEEEEEEDQDDGDQQQHEQPKQEEEDDDDGGDDDEEDQVEEDQHQPDDDDDDEVNEEEDDENIDNDESSPPIRRRNVEGRPAEAGIIKTVLVENFMCHRKLKVDLCRNVNFIHGQNGSGKSAILAAIQICLGANARRTHRARNIKDLVRKEAAGTNPNTCAKVSVTLRNEGEDAFKPETYGDIIRVERTINRGSGFNGYKLFNADGKEVSRKKCDLDEMLDFLNIQVDNPVAILDQEEAKKFLTGRGSAKYEFFMKATELSRIDKVFANTLDRADELEGQKERIADSLVRKKELVGALKKKKDEFQAVELLEKKRLAAEIDYSWAFYAERNNEYETAVQKKHLYDAKLEERQKELTQAEEEASGANDKDEETRIRDRMLELQNEANSQAKLKRDLEAEVKIAQNPVKEASSRLKTLASQKKAAGKELIRAQKRLKDTRNEIAAREGSAESEQARRTAQLNETEEAIAKAKAEQPKIHEALSRAYRDCEEQEPEYQQAKQIVSSKSKQVYAVKSKLRELTSSNLDDPAAIFGRKCSDMVKLVDQARRKGVFRGDVLGPIGVFLKIAPGKEKYSALVETFLGNNSLDRFIVSNPQDRQEFEKLRRKLKCSGECGTFQQKPHRGRFNVPAPPAPEIETIASCLIVSNDTVFNCLVDNLKIDQRALAPSKEISEQHLLVNDNGRFRMQGNITEVAFLPNGDCWFTRNGSVAITSRDKKRSGKKIGVDRTEAIKEGEAELAGLEEELKDLQKAERDLERQKTDLKKAWNEHNKARRQNQGDLDRLTKQKADIENEMETTANITVDTTEMEEDVALAEEALQTPSTEEDSVKEELEALQPTVDDAKKRLEEVRTRNEKVLKDMKLIDDELEACVQRQTQSEAELEKKRGKVKKLISKGQQFQSEIDTTKNARDSALSQARKLTLYQRKQEEKEQEEEEESGGGESSQPTVSQFQGTEEELENVEIQEVPKESDFYEAKVKRAKAKIAKEKERRNLQAGCEGTLAEATEKWLLAKQDLSKTNEGYDDAKRLHQETLEDLGERKRRWRKLRTYLQKMTDSRFDSILQLNQASGEIEFDDENGELNLTYQKNKHDPNSQTKDVKALSGGERSYTTISLLLALGESLETPFRLPSPEEE